MRPPNIARDIVQRIYNDTEGYADGAPDASAHDKLCNHVSSLARRALVIMETSDEIEGATDQLEHYPKPGIVSKEYGRGFAAGALFCAVCSSIAIAIAIFLKP
jgi:hypothetical protein